MENQQESKEQTKKCPKCGEEILMSAKICKHCKADLRNWFLKHRVITGVLILIVIGIISSVSGKDKGENKVVSSDNKQKQEQVIYKVSDIIKAGNLEIMITSAQEKKQVGSQYFKSNPSEGGTYITVQWKYKNTSDKPINSFSQPRINLVDGSGTIYDLDLGASGNYATELKLDRKILSDLNPGISVNDAGVFEISKENYTKGGWSILIKSDGKEYKVNVN